MEVSSASALRRSNPFCRVSPLRSNPNSSSFSSSTTALRNSRDLSLLFLKIPSRRFSYVSSSRKLQISLSYGPVTKRRRNSLREKLVAREDQVRRTPEVLIPDFNFQTESRKDENFDLDLQIENDLSSSGQGDDREATGGDDTGKAKLPRESVLWSKLENWVGQYKKDSECWGVGSGPIFTVIQDSDGNVARVSVNENEIIKRSRVEPWSFQPKGSGEDFMDANAKISRAKLIAEEVASGAYRLPSNSSIAKFVTEGKGSSFLGGFPTVALKGKPILKLSPYLGLMVLCGGFVLWVARKTLGRNDRKELSSEEREMLRRKMKSRMERDKVEKGCVEVLQNDQELPVTFNSRPLLDKNELMKNLTKAKASRDGFVSYGSSSHFTNKIVNFEDKVKEIREMARRARQLERQEHPQIDKKGECNEVSAMSLASEDKDYAFQSNVYIEAESAVDVSDGSDTLDDTNKIDLAGGIQESESAREKKSVSVDYILPGESATIFDTNGIPEVDHSGTDLEPLKVDSEGSNLHSISRNLNMEVLENEQQVERHTHAGERITLHSMGRRKDIEAKLTPSDSSSSLNSSSIRVKPKIISSVSEAREYLNRRRTTLPDEMRTGQEVQVKSLAVGIDVHKPAYDDEHDGKTRLVVSERTEVAKSSMLELLHKEKSPAQESQREETDVEGEGNTIKDVNMCNDDIHNKDPYMAKEDTKMQKEENPDLPYKILERDLENPHGFDEVMNFSSVDDFGMGESSDMPDGLDTEDTQSCAYADHTSFDESSPSTSSLGDKPRVTKVIEESRSHHSFRILTDKGHPDQEVQSEINQVVTGVCDITETEELNWQECQNNGKKGTSESVEIDEKLDLTSGANLSTDCKAKAKHTSVFQSSLPLKLDKSKNLEKSTRLNAAEVQRDEKEHNLNDFDSLYEPGTNSSQGSDDTIYHNEAKEEEAEKLWIEKNFDVFEPIVKKIDSGFKDNYMMAKEKVQEQRYVTPQLSDLRLMEDSEELEWMTDDSLREIVFKVRENELAGRDPFHLMEPDGQRAFFEGLERKAEKVNKQLLVLHEWVHSRIENIDYGADGISLDDPLEKLVPRWKGPPIDEDPEFLNFTKPRKAFFAENVGTSHAMNEDAKESLQKCEKEPNSDGVLPSSPVPDTQMVSKKGTPITPKTVIECSDGSVRAGKKSGKEHWQHTKKWSREFLELYNAETDPEVKSVMKDMGKDLDKWITEKEVQDVADLMTRIPQKKRRNIEKKLDKLKKEMEMFGPQAVVSKYREYSEEKEEDSLWWLDLPFVLCIELYTIEKRVQKIGFYSLEMASDLELNPKQHHVIAFEDPGDSRNFCYIIQAHLDMLGSGSAFVVARPPKDAFREAKATGFQVTVLRKGELKLNIDQTLEEVEEEIVEIGSKIYHDKIMRERSVDIRALMKGVFGAGKSKKRSSRRALRNPATTN